MLRSGSVRRRHATRGMTLVEVLVAAMILGIAAGGAVASWGWASKAAANKRATEIGYALCVGEVERLKAIRYPYLTPSAIVSGSPVPSIRWFDKYGSWLGSGATTGAFRVETIVTVLIDRDNTANSEDLKEVVVETWDGNRTKMYDRARTLLTFGGV